MTPELAALAAIAVIQIIMIGVAQQSLTADIGRDGNMGPRDGTLPLSPRTQRLRRAVANHVENIGLFIIAVVVVTLSGQATTFTASCAWVFVAARALYLPAYLYGWTPWRSVIWAVGMAATLLMLAAAFI
ncbi:MAPEG family protein [Tabrizicola sp.]|uniref:MAPEG family protein n=1 Tax=Tabrizicola sp. TaxID=2005166 RepID=UPI002FDDE927